MSDHVPFAFQCAELALAGAGCVLLWRHALSPAARANRAPQLLPWNALPIDFLFFLLYVVGGGFFGGVLGATLLKLFEFTGDAAVLLGSAAGQIGMLVGVAIYFRTHTDSATAPTPTAAPAPATTLASPVVLPDERAVRPCTEPAAASPSPLVGRGIFLSGTATFLMSLPLLMAASKLWEIFLRALGLPAEKQDVVEMFMRAKSPVLLIAMIVLAVVIAPVTEELVFRAGLFRYFRTRLPFGLGFLIPALVFAALHVQWTTLANFASFAPLTVLALLFSAAYERSGRIGTSIVAHALFNLNTVVLILGGVRG